MKLKSKFCVEKQVWRENAWKFSYEVKRLQVLDEFLNFWSINFKRSYLDHHLSPWGHSFCTKILRIWNLSPYKFWILKVFVSCLKKSKDYRSFHKFPSTSQGHNFLNFWSFWLVLFEKCSLRDLIHFIFEWQEKILNGRPCLDWKHYMSFFAKLRNFSKCEKVSLFLVISKSFDS